MKNPSKKQGTRKLTLAMCLLTAFGLWTLAVCRIDVQPVGLNASPVGFAAVNQFVHQSIGVHLSLYTLTDCLSLIPLGCAAGFALLGLAQWIRRKQLLKVDHSLLLLGGFYIVVMAFYVFFEHVIINYRPILIDGAIEASYPSSTTLLVLCIMPTTAMQLKARIRRAPLKRYIGLAIAVFTAFMLIARVLSGVHWLTDILGGILLSAGLVMGYRALVILISDHPKRNSP